MSLNSYRRASRYRLAGERSALQGKRERAAWRAGTRREYFGALVLLREECRAGTHDARRISLHADA